MCTYPDSVQTCDIQTTMIAIHRSTNELNRIMKSVINNHLSFDFLYSNSVEILIYFNRRILHAPLDPIDFLSGYYREYCLDKKSLL